MQTKELLFSPFSPALIRRHRHFVDPPLVAKHRLHHLKKASFSLRQSSLEIQFSQRFPVIRSPDRFLVGDSLKLCIEKQ